MYDKNGHELSVGDSVIYMNDRETVRGVVIKFCSIMVFIYCGQAGWNTLRYVRPESLIGFDNE